MAAAPSTILAHAQQTRGQSRYLGRSEEQQSLPGGLRRRPLRELRPGGHVDLQGQPSDRAVLRRGGERGCAVLSRLRRHAGQQQLRLRRAHQEHVPDQRRLLRHQRRRRFLLARRSQGPQHHLRQHAERRHGAVRQAHRRARLDPAAAGQGRPAHALELGYAADRQPAFQYAAVLRRAAALSQRRPRR